MGEALCVPDDAGSVPQPRGPWSPDPKAWRETGAQRCDSPHHGADPWPGRAAWAPPASTFLCPSRLRPCSRERPRSSQLRVAARQLAQVTSAGAAGGQVACHWHQWDFRLWRRLMTSRDQYHWKKILLLTFPKERGHVTSLRATWGGPRFGQEAERGRGRPRPDPFTGVFVGNARQGWINSLVLASLSSPSSLWGPESALSGFRGGGNVRCIGAG